MEKSLEEIRDLLQMIILSTKKVYTIDDVSKVTGYKKSYIYRLVSNGDLKTYKPTNGQAFIEREELESWLLKNKVEVKEQTS